MSETLLPPWPWDSPRRALIQSSLQHLAAQLGPGPVYLLIDPRFGDPPGVATEEAKAGAVHDGMQRAREAAWERQVHTLHSSDFSSFTEPGFPYLVCLDGDSDPLLERSVEWAMQEHLDICAIGSGPYRIGGWLQPHSAPQARVRVLEQLSSGIDHEGQVLARQLAGLLQFTDGRGERRMVRLFDRRVLHTLRQGTRIDWEPALQGIACWNYLDHNLRLQTLKGCPGAPLSQSLIDGDAHVGLLNRCHALHLAQSAWLRTTFPLPGDAFDKAMRQVQAARHRRLLYPADQAAYAAEALTEPAFAHWPKRAALLDSVVRNGQELGDALDGQRHNWADKAPDHWTVQGHS